MSVLQAILLGVVQGLTEFIPISSTAHLAIAQALLKIRDADLARSFDLVLHLGTALALIVATRKLLAGIASEALRAATGRPSADETDRALLAPIVVGTIPGVLAGLFLLKRFEVFRTLSTIGIAMMVACVYFLVAERVGERGPSSERRLSGINWLDALLVGLAQAAAGPRIKRQGRRHALFTMRPRHRLKVSDIAWHYAIARKLPTPQFQLSPID